MAEYEIKPFEKFALDARLIAEFWSMVAIAIKDKKCSLNAIGKSVDHILDLQHEWLLYESVYFDELIKELPKD